MKHTNSKFFIMFLAGILFSTITVFAATISVNTDFTSNAVQYLQNLVLTDASGATGVVLDGAGKEIHTDTICKSDGSQCKNISDIFTGTETDPEVGTLTNGKWCTNDGSKITCNVTPVTDTNTQLNESNVDAFVSNNGYQRAGEDITVNDGGSIKIGELNPQSAQSFATNGAIRIGNTSRDEQGSIRYNGTRFEGYDGSHWIDLGGGAGTETDPIFSSHSGDYYTKIDSDAKYLTSYNELWNTGSNNSINYMNGNVGIGTNSAPTTLTVNGIIKLSVESTTCNGRNDGGKLRYISGGHDCQSGQTGTPGVALELCATNDGTNRGWEIIGGNGYVECHDSQA